MMKSSPIKSPLINNTLNLGFQKIDFTSAEHPDTYEVIAEDVMVTLSSGDHDSGSSKIKMVSVVDYTWEERFHTGHLLAIHLDGVYIAYGIKGPNKATGIIRVVNRQTDQRALIKDMEGAVQDIVFAHIPKNVVLACMDLKGNLFVYKILVVEKQLMQPLICELVLHILPDPAFVPQGSDFFRVVWCPYIPEVLEDDVSSADRNDYIAWQLALTRGSKIELWNVHMVVDSHGVGPVYPGQVPSGYLEINEHTQPIVAATFSPDGTAIATASLDGEVKFFQVYMQDVEKPRCLHHWKPHGGQPLSSLFFLDNHKNYNPEVQFWKFAITGAKNNSELKVWSCESWLCLQTLGFKDVSENPIKLNACIDSAAGYLLLSDFHRKILYVLQLSTSLVEASAAIISVSEFLLPCPILSFGIVEAGLCHFKTDDLEELSSEDSDEDSVAGVLVKMYLVQPKSLQDCRIAFVPPKQHSFNQSQLLPIEQSPFYIPHSPLPNEEKDLLGSIQNHQELSSHHSSLQQLNLMTPDAFNSPVKHETSSSSLLNHHIEEQSFSNATTMVASPHSADNVDNNRMPASVEISSVLASFGFASGGSSPSREVQEILSEGKCFYGDSDEIQQEPDQPDLKVSEDAQAQTGWPEIPMLKMPDVRKNEEQVQQSGSQGDSSVAGEGDLWMLAQRLETSISSMINVMNSLMQASEEQANEIKQLRDEVQQQHLLSEVDKTITRNAQQQIVLLEKILASKNNKQYEAAITSSITQSLNNFLNTTFLETVTNDIKLSLVPAMVGQMDSLKQQVLFEFSQKLNSIDQLLKDDINKMLNSESVVKILSSTVASTLKPVLSNCYKEYFTTLALPGLEKTTATLFSQIDSTFLKGTKEYITTLGAQSKHFSEKNREQCSQLQVLSEILKNTSTEMNKEIKKSIASIEKKVMESVTRALTMQQAVLEGSVMAAVQSRSVTPAPHVIDLQAMQNQIIHLIGKGDINGAFQQALTASDLSLVVFICEKVNPQQLFSQEPCPLQQHVLLSLVQQLSADMNNHTEIKQRYLEEALMNLDVKNKLTREHLPSVLTELQRQLQTFINNNPSNKVTRSMRILLMASQAVYSSTGAPPPTL